MRRLNRTVFNDQLPETLPNKINGYGATLSWFGTASAHVIRQDEIEACAIERPNYRVEISDNKSERTLKTDGSFRLMVILWKSSRASSGHNCIMMYFRCWRRCRKVMKKLLSARQMLSKTNFPRKRVDDEREETLVDNKPKYNESWCRLPLWCFTMRRENPEWATRG